MPVNSQLMKKVTECRCCGSKELVMYLDLGMMPLANNLCETFDKAIHTGRYPLQVMLCERCGLSQLSVVIDPEILFSHYVYRSSINKGYVDHCREMAKSLQFLYGLTKDSFMIDIAGNDGALLSEFRDEIGLKVLNIDPAVNLSPFNDAKKIRILNEFWGTATANKLNGFGKADLITATNVFAHVDDVHDFLNGCKVALKDSGVIVIEFPYLLDFIKNNEFDTVYFEHLSYFSIRPLIILANKVGLFVNHVEHFDIHGGSVRVHLQKHSNKKDSFFEFTNKERFFDRIETYSGYAQAVNDSVKAFADEMLLLSHKAKIAAFGASAKGNTFLCFASNYSQIDFIVDETPEKIGKYSPGNGLPIVDMNFFIANMPDYLIILAWNFADEIMAKCKAAGYKGKFIIPIPLWKVV